MTVQQLILSHSTRLAVTIVIEDDTGMMAFTLLFVTRLLVLAWQVGRLMGSVGRELSTLISDIRAAIEFTGKVLVIGLNALAFGLGVK